jgi:dTDP-4-amino-4,6-dideoxygalactose transaminase
VLDESAKVDRAGLGQHLTERGIGNGIYYPRLVHDYACFRDRPDVVVDPTPVAARLAAGCLSLPLHAKLSPADVAAAVDAVREALVV